MKIPDKPFRYWLRWFCLVPAIFAIFMCLGLGLAFLNSVLHFWLEPTAGFILALAWVLSAAIIAPDRKSIAGLAAFVIGAMLAWKFVGRSYYPENHPKAYEPTYIPFAITLAGGLLGIVGSLIMTIRKANKAPHAASGPVPVPTP